MVSCSQPLAAQIGIRLLQSGANAVEAAVAMGAAIAVLEPCSTGLGGDVFMSYFDLKTVTGLNGSGKSPSALTLEAFREATKDSSDSAPSRHAMTVTVPGAAAAWVDAIERWGGGKFTLADLLAPAIELARKGFPVAPVTSHIWSKDVSTLIDAAVVSGVSEVSTLCDVSTT